MFNLKSLYPIGIDIGKKNLYAAQLRKTRQGFAVKGLGHRELNGDADDALISALKEISGNGQFHGKRVTVHLPPQNVLSFPIRFQVASEASLEEAILRESKAYITFPIEEAIIDYPSLISPSPGGANQYSAIITAIRREHIEQYLRMLKQAGLIPEAVDFAVCSLIRLHNFLHNTTNNLSILCHIGYTQSLLSAVTKEGIIAERTVPWGTKIPLKKIMLNFELTGDEHKAGLLLKKYGLVHENRNGSDKDINLADETETGNIRAVYQIIAPHIEELAGVFHEMIGYLRSEERNGVVEGIYIYGQGALIHNLEGYIEGKLHIPTQVINAMTKFGLPDDAILQDSSDGASFALALGLAMRKVSWL